MSVQPRAPGGTPQLRQSIPLERIEFAPLREATLAASTAHSQRLDAKTNGSSTLPPVLNPLRSEGEAFRLLIYVIAFFAVVIALVLILRAVL